MTTMSLMASFSDPINQGVLKDPHVTQVAIILPFMSHFLVLVEQFNFLQIFCASGFDSSLCYLAYCSALDDYWSRNSLSMPF